MGLLLLWSAAAYGGPFTVFGPEDFVRSAGKPTGSTRTFPAAVPGTGYILHIDNGGSRQQFGRVTSASVKLNGAVIAGPSDFKQGVQTIDKPITLAAQNTLKIELQGSPGNGFTVTVLRQDAVAPTIAITSPSEPVIKGNPTPAVAVTYSDALSGVDTTTLQIAIDGSALAGCNVGPATATCTPPALSGGHHMVTTEVRDRAGNLGMSSFGFDLVLDGDPPVVQFLSPGEGSFLPSPLPTITASYVDTDSGVDTQSVRLLLDGIDRTAEATVNGSALFFEPSSPLAEGEHTASVRLRDLSGNESQATVHFTTDSAPPSLAIVEPTSSVLSDQTTTPVRVTYADPTSGIDLATLLIEVDGSDLGPSCSIATGAATCQSPELSDGFHTVTALLRDQAGNLATATFSFEVDLDQAVPSLSITSPSSPLIQGNASPTIRVEYYDVRFGIDLASLRILADAADLTASCQVGPEAATCTPPPLERGPHTVSARIADHRGNAATASFEFALVFPLKITITEPAPDTLTSVASVRVVGAVSPQARSVTVSGVVAEISGGTFQIDTLGLHDGVNELVAVAEDAFGNIGTASVRVIADTTPPNVGVTFPVDGATVSTPAITVTGLVNDLTIGTVSDTQVTVTINGVPARVENRSFVATGIPLQHGPNMLTVMATDRAGNRTAAEVQVTLEERIGAPSLQIVSGDGQVGSISTQLPEPLIVGVSDSSGQPLRDVQVVFRVVRGNGVLAEGEQAAVAQTDSQGRATMQWTLGSRAGVGVDRVRATAVGIAGEVSFIATAQTAVPAAINVASGDNQRGLIGDELARPLVVVVTDAGHNPVSGIPVTFRIVNGGGGFAEAGGADTATVETDQSGLASVRLTLGPSSGLDNNRVEAAFAGLSTLPAGFKASAFLPGDPSHTLISGVVLDNQGTPVPGVTMRLRDSGLMAVTDAVGQFRLTGVPVGQVFLIADATTATRPGSWASLEYELFALPGVDNTLPRPIYILPLDLPNGVFVDETRGGTVRLPEVPGFALEIAPGSVTFPGGGRSGVVSVTAVHADRIPMPPGAGMQPRLIVTIQPSGAHFDPPAPITLPNVDGLAPGTVTELFSFDHDIGEFVAIGTGTVGEDGLVVRSDPGVGILEAGWHCGAPPSGRGESASLSVKIRDTDKPLIFSANGGPANTVVVQALGAPSQNIAYTWEIDDTNVAEITPSGPGLCRGESTCATQVTSKKHGKARLKVLASCTTTPEQEPAEDWIDIYTGYQIAEVISEQVPNSECNKLPPSQALDNSVLNKNRPMLVGATEGNEVSLSVRVHPDLTEAQAKFLCVGVRKVGSNEPIPCVAARANREKVKIDFLAESGHYEYEIVSGVDRNQDGKLNSLDAANEVHDVFADKVRVITKFDYELASYTAPPLVGIAHELRNVFLGIKQQPSGAEASSEIIGLDDHGLTHPVGANWDANCKAAVRHFTFPKSSDASVAVAQSHAIRASLRRFLDQIRGVIAECVANSPCVLRDYNWTEKINFLSYLAVDPAFAFGFGKVTLFGQIVQLQATTDHRGCIGITDITYGGHFTDLYDFDYTDPNVAIFATVQVGNPTLAPEPKQRGAIFVSQVDFEHQDRGFVYGFRPKSDGSGAFEACNPF